MDLYFILSINSILIDSCFIEGGFIIIIVVIIIKNL